MLKDRNFLFVADLVEVVHVELPDKRRELLMFEIFGKNFILKQFLILNDEAISVISPLDNMTILFLFKDLICLDDEV